MRANDLYIRLFLKPWQVTRDVYKVSRGPKASHSNDGEVNRGSLRLAGLVLPTTPILLGYFSSGN